MTKQVMLFFMIIMWLPRSQAEVVLYEGEGSPEKLGWLAYHQFPLPPSFLPPSLISLTVPLAEGAYTPFLKTDLGLGNTGYVGYSNYQYTLSPEQLQSIHLEAPKETFSQGIFVPVNHQFPILDRKFGFEIAFNVAVTHETSEIKQAGFHVVAISSDGKGVVLGFRSKQASDKKSSKHIFAQSAQFEEAEGLFFDISVPTDYVLTLSGTKYTLFANGKKLFFEQLREYSWDPSKTSLPINPYVMPNFIFFGDIHDQGQSHFNLGKITVRQSPPPLGEGTGHAVDATGTELETAAKFRGGISINGNSPASLRLTPKLSDQVDVVGEVTVDPKHVGKNADLIVYAAYKATPHLPAGYRVFYMLDRANNVLVWDRAPQNLAAFKASVTLQEKHFLQMYRGQFVLPGHLCIHFGYRLQEEGTVVTNEECIDVTIKR